MSQLQAIRCTEPEPLKRLWTAVILQSINELHSKDIIESLEALMWWLESADAWLVVAGFGDVEPEQALRFALGGDWTYAKKLHGCNSGRATIQPGARALSGRGASTPARAPREIAGVYNGLLTECQTESQ